MSDEIQEKISVLEQRKTTLLDTWELRNGIYKRHLDTQVRLVAIRHIVYKGC